jgi:hypothetical protein
LECAHVNVCNVSNPSLHYTLSNLFLKHADGVH